jgi:hypothetical protein
VNSSENYLCNSYLVRRCLGVFCGLGRVLSGCLFVGGAMVVISRSYMSLKGWCDDHADCLFDELVGTRDNESTASAGDQSHTYVGMNSKNE